MQNEETNNEIVAMNFSSIEFKDPDPEISCWARNANSPERRLVVGFMVANMLKAD